MTEATLPIAAAAEAPFVPPAEWLRAARRAKALSWLSLVWMGAEGAIAITAGITAGSIALVGFGLDSAIEGIASLVIVWRFTGHRLLSHTAEERAQKLVAIQFFLLAPFVAYEALRHLITGADVETSWVGMVLTATSLVGMPILGVAKQRVAVTLGSAATHGEGAQNLLCAYLAGAVFLGLAGNALFGWWWLDPIAALVIAAVAVKEGLETWRGEGCCAVGAPADLPIACSLSAAQLPARLAAMAELGRRALTDVELAPRRARLRFAATADVRARVEEIAAAESDCCAFLTLGVTGGPDDVVLTIIAPAGAELVLAELVGAFRAAASA